MNYVYTVIYNGVPYLIFIHEKIDKYHVFINVKIKYNKGWYTYIKYQFKIIN